MPTRPRYMNIDRMRARLETSQFDAVIASSFTNVYYLTGAMIETQRRLPMRLALTVWPREGEPILIVGDIEEGLARRESFVDDVRAYVEFRQSPIELLTEVLREKRLERGTLGIESEHLVAHYYEELQQALPGATLKSADRFFDDVRMIKTRAEVELLGEASRKTEKAIQHAYNHSRSGDTEQEVAFRIIEHLLLNGADSMRFMVLGAGDNGAIAHHIPGLRPIETGDTIRQDVGAYYHGYASDVARMAFVGEPSRRQADVYKKMWEIHVETMDAVRPGAQARDVYFTCKDAFEKRGLEFKIPHVGHGSGVGGGHEEPILHPLNHAVLEPGMLICIEPIYKEAGLGGYHIEDLLLVTENGNQLLTDATPTREPTIIAI